MNKPTHGTYVIADTQDGEVTIPWTALDEDTLTAVLRGDHKPLVPYIGSLATGHRVVTGRSLALPTSEAGVERWGFVHESAVAT